MAAGLTTPTEAGQGPSVLNIAMSIGAKIRDAAEDAKEQKEKAAEKGETPKKGSLFKSALANQFNPIKSKKAKSNWAKQFDWNKETKSDQQVKPPSGEGGDSKGKLKEFIAGGFTAILKDTGLMVSKLDGVKMMTGENLSEVTRASSTLTVIKDSIDAQTELRRKALEEAKFARAERKLEKTSDVAGLSDVKSADGKDKGDGGDGGGKGPLDWLLDALGLADIATSIPGIGKVGKFFNRFNPFRRPTVTQGAGGKPPGMRMPGSGPRVTTSGGAPAPRVPGGSWWSRMNPFANPAVKTGLQTGMRGATGLMGGIGKGLLGAGRFGLNLLGKANLPLLAASVITDTGGQEAGAEAHLQKYGTRQGELYAPEDLNPDGTPKPGAQMRPQFSEGGIVPSAVPPSPISPMAEGGVVDNPTKTTLNPGDSVIPLNRNVGKQMLGNKNQTTPGETAVDTVGAMILGVSAGMLGKTESGTVGDQVKQDIRKASKQFGISNLTFTSSIGRGQFGKVDTKKDSKDFLMAIFKNMSLFGGGDGSKGKGGGGNEKPPGADIENTQVKNEVDLAANTHKDVGFTPGQQFGDRNGAHRGSDIGTSGQKGYYVALKKKGKVVNNDFDDTSGNWVGIDVGGGVEYRFMHLAQRSPLKVGQEYNGETIGEIGNTGRSSGEHLHFEKLVNGKHVDPKSDASALLSIGKGIERKFDPKDTAKPPVHTKPTGQDTGTQGSGDQASMPNAKVTQLAQDGGAWWNPFSWGKVVDKHRNTKSTDYANPNSPFAKMAKQREMMKELGYQGGGTNRRPNYNQMQRAARIKQQQASVNALNSGKGLNLKGAGLGTNIGKGYPAVYKGREAIKVKLPPGGSYEPEITVGGKRFFAIKQGDSVIYASHFKANQKNLGVGAKPAQAPKPAPARTPATGGGTRPAPSSSSSPQSAVAVMPSASASKPPSAQAVGSFGSAVPGAKTSAMVFADFLYPDLV